MRRGLLSGICVGSALACLVPAAQAAPTNDAFAAATALTAGTEVSSSNLGATVEPGEPALTGGDLSGSCNTITEGPNCGASVWYAFQPSSSGEYTIETCDAGTDLETVLGVYSGSGYGSLTKVASDENTTGCAGGRFGTNARVSFNATGGTVYHVEVAGNYGDQGSFYLRAYAGAPQPRPTPDTGIIRRSSLITELNTFGGGPGATSGLRHSASFALFSAPGATFQCSMDGAPFAPCTTPISSDDLPPGTSHVLQARATLGGLTDPTPAIERFTIDTAPPDTSLISGPTGSLASQKAAWRVVGSKRYDMGTFACGLDGMPADQCNGGDSFENLCQGPHTFRAAALDTAANRDPTPLSVSVNVTVGPPCAAPTIEALPASPEANFATVYFNFDNKGAGAGIHIEWGTTTSYGEEREEEGWGPSPTPTTSKHGLVYLTPGTLYHYRATITTPFGTATTPDQTFTTGAAKGALPSVANGTPVVVGQHAVDLPATIDGGGTDFVYRPLITVGKPVTLAGTLLSYSETILGGGGPKSVSTQVVDLEPSTTYHYRMAAEQVSGNGYDVLGPEGTFTTPPFPAAKSHFKLKRKNVKVSKLKRRTRVLVVKLHGVPESTLVKAELRVGRKRVRKSGKVEAGKLTLKLRMKRRFHQALLGKHKAKLTVTATPPGDTSSSVGFTVRIQKPHKPRRHH